MSDVTSATGGSAATGQTTGSSSADSDVPDPMANYDANFDSDNPAMALDMGKMLKEQMYMSQMTTMFQFRSSMIKSFFDCLKGMASKID